MEKNNNDNTFKIKGNVLTDEHIKSKTNADTLFRFLDKYEYLQEIIENKRISPRYYTEDVSYLKRSEITKLTYPMICFCDINLHRLKEHVKFYGSYGVAFKKQWGMKNKIQPVHYINSDSELCKYLSDSFIYYLENVENLNIDDVNANFLLIYLMHIKPYDGIMKRNGKSETKCFEDECEWRYVPNIGDSYQQVYVNEDGANLYNTVSDVLKEHEEFSLKFDYDDLKYIFVKNNDDLKKMILLISKLFDNNKINEDEKYFLISKIIVWDEQMEDF